MDTFEDVESRALYGAGDILFFFVQNAAGDIDPPALQMFRYIFRAHLNELRHQIGMALHRVID